MLFFSRLSALVLMLNLFTAISLYGDADEQARKTITLEKENQSIQEYSNNITKFYELAKGEKWRDITDEVLVSPDTSQESKESIRAFQRRIIVFKYPSDGLWVKGFLATPLILSIIRC